MPTPKESARSIAFRWAVLTGADLGAKAAGFGATLAIVHHFGAPNFGSLTLATSVVGYALILAVGGTDTYAVRAVAGRPDRMAATFGEILSLRIVLAALAYLLLLFVSWLVPSVRPVIGLVALAGLSLFSTTMLTLWAPQAIHQTHVIAAANLGTQVCYFLLVVAAIGSGWGIWSAPVALAVAEALAGIAVLNWMVRRLGRWSLAINPTKWLAILRESAPVAGSSLLRTVALGSDAIILSFFVPMLQIGYYSGAHRIYLLGVSAINVCVVIILPRLVQRAAVSGDAMRREMIVGLLRTAPVAAAGAVVLAFFANDILRIVLGSDFTSATRSLQILLITVAVTFVSTHARLALMARGQQQLDLLFVAIASVVHVVLKLILTKHWGIEGAALGTCLGEIVLMLLGLQAALRRGPTPLSRSAP